MNLRPIGNNVLAKYIIENQPVKGIMLPDSSIKKSPWLEVVDSSLECEYLLSPGDKILIEKYSGSDVTYHDREYIVVNAKNILAVELL